MTSLPIATNKSVRAYAKILARDFRRPMFRALWMYAIAGIASLIGPTIIGHIVNDVTAGTLTSRGITYFALGLIAASLINTASTFLARRRSYILGESVFARLREDFMARVLELPLSVVERPVIFSVARQMTLKHYLEQCVSRCPNGWSPSCRHF